MTNPSPATPASKMPRKASVVPQEFRTVELRRESVKAEDRTVELAFASEFPVERWWGTEILDMQAGSVRLGRLNGARHPLLVDHSTRDQVGVVERAWIDDDRTARAIVRFGKSARAEEIFQDVVDGIRSLVSVGYALHRAVLESRDEDTDTSTYRITDWEPFEVSIVAIPADPTVGIGRTPETELQMRSFLPTPQKPPSRETAMSDEIRDAGAPAPKAPTVDVTAVENQARTAELARMREILSMGDYYGLRDQAQEAINKGTTVDDFRKLVLEDLKAKGTQKATERNIGLTDKQVVEYSISRAILAMLDPSVRAKGGFEIECHNAVMQRLGEPKHGGILIPHDVLSRQMIRVDSQRLGKEDPNALAALTGQRDLTAGTASAGGYLVGTQNVAGSFIELLRARARVVQLGAIVLPGLRESVTIPKQTAAGTFYWLTNEATAITESQQTFGQVALAPKNGGAYTEVSMQLLKQSAPAADMLVMADLSKVCALGIDLAALNGSGASGQPTGVLNTAGIGSVSGTSLNWAGIVEFETDVSTANADVATLAYLTTPAVRGLLKARDKTGTTVGNYVWGGTTADNRLNGYRAEVSTQVPSATMLFGDFSQIVIGEWGTLEISANPYANFPAGITGIRAWVTVDVGVRQAGAFSAASSIT